MESEMVGLISGSVSGLEGRIFPLVLPQDTDLPACTFQRIDTIIEIGQEVSASPLEHARVQFSVYAKTFSDVRTQAEGIRDLFNGYNGGGFHATFIENILDDIEEETGLRKSIVDVVSWKSI